MRPALYDTGGGDERKLGLLLELRYRQGAAVAHGRLDLEERHGNIVLERASVRHIGIHAFFIGKLLFAARETRSWCPLRR